MIILLTALLLAGCEKSDSVSSSPPVTAQTGKVVIAAQFDEAMPFSEGLAAVKIGTDKAGKWGYIDKQGKMVIAAQFDEVTEFSNGLAAVGVGTDKARKWGYIDRQGKMVIEPQFVYATPFSEGLAQVEIAGKRGYIAR